MLMVRISRRRLGNRGRRARLFGSLCLLLTVAGASEAVAQASDVLRGSVRDSAGNPVAYANVAASQRARVVTDIDGTFELVMKRSKAVTLAVRRLGYAPLDVRVEPGDSVIAIAMSRLALALPGMEVIAEGIRSLETRGFYGRLTSRKRGVGSGVFFTPEEVERRNLSRITQLFDNVPGIKIEKSGMGAVEWVITGGINRCPVTVFLDGSAIFPPKRWLHDPLRRIQSDEWVDALVDHRSVVAAEVYTRASGAPAQYQMLNGTCGIVLLWTR
jgi:hypothetical protein